ncbi:hypothetical protein TRIP_B30021 [uncultured Desulfatiglans sp.]|uniref:Uncharacterized protein n=1 Tax=Uncultured Desulfatiglans sp. TaxID=1748965 RepID=A0A653A6E9_UNCDX|nr:hypothetical protein TRIP_B30021 [uncultured Desulfatiglans sp.]
MDRDTLQDVLEQPNPDQRAAFPSFGGMPNAKKPSSLIVARNTQGRSADSQQTKSHPASNTQGLLVKEGEQSLIKINKGLERNFGAGSRERARGNISFETIERMKKLKKPVNSLFLGVADKIHEEMYHRTEKEFTIAAKIFLS